MPSRRLVTILALAATATAVGILLKKKSKTHKVLDWPALGEVVHTHNGVPIYSNGFQIFKSHGKHNAEDGYYYGRKWQCVEFVKRYYHDVHAHHMPNVWGHAKDFYQNDLTSGSINEGRGMLQFANGSNQAPKPDDLLVWNNEPYGHVAIIAEVHSDHIIVAQQNIYGAATERFELQQHEGNWTIHARTAPVGWLRLP